MDIAEKAWQRDALPKGTVLNGYRVEGIIGRGGLGITYLAVDKLDQSSDGTTVSGLWQEGHPPPQQ